MKQVWKGAMLFLLTLLPFASAHAKPTEAEQMRKIIDKVNQHWQATNSPEVRLGQCGLSYRKYGSLFPDRK